MNLLLLLSFFSILVSAAGHARLKHPKPLAAPPETPAGNVYYNWPLKADGSDFPCKGLHKKAGVDKTPTETWVPGQMTRFEILGHGSSGGEGCLAAHSGGSCQASISFDDGETWKVLHSFQGGCPRGVRLGSNMADKNQTFPFLVPENTRAGNALFSWTWVAVTGNRNEFFQNCASIRIAGSGTSTLDHLPDVFVGDMSIPGHIGAGECRSTAGVALEYHNPGEAVTMTKFDNIGFKKATGGKCYPKATKVGSTTANPSSSTSSKATTSTKAPTTVKTTTSTTPKTTTIKLTTTKAAATTTTKVGGLRSEGLGSTVTAAPGVVGNLPQCSSYMTITDKTRRSTHADAVGCDNGLFKAGPTWVRFSGEAGTRLAPGPAQPFRCGTQGAGWYKGAYPTGPGLTTTGTVCYSWPNNNCQWSNEISVTDCNGFYVYLLHSPPACYLRYCTV